MRHRFNLYHSSRQEQTDGLRLRLVRVLASAGCRWHPKTIAPPMRILTFSRIRLATSLPLLGQGAKALPRFPVRLSGFCAVALLALTAVPLSRDVHAAELDCETDDTEALRRAFRAVGPAGKIVVPAGGRLRVASGCQRNWRTK